MVMGTDEAVMLALAKELEEEILELAQFQVRLNVQGVSALAALGKDKT